MRSDEIREKIKELRRDLQDLELKYSLASIKEAQEASEFKPGDPIEFYTGGWRKGVFGGFVYTWRAQSFVHPLKKDGTPSNQKIMNFNNIRKA
ncbi:MAG: hypothetical protein H6546_02670 [Chitinophagales bacterium]|nr:hypothetical protein [Chitinophagales bacterium]